MGKNCDLQLTKDFTKRDPHRANFEKCDVEIVAPRHSPGIGSTLLLWKWSEKGTNFKQNAN